MLYVLVVRAVAGLAVLGAVGVVLAVATQGLGMWFTDNRLEARERRNFEEKGWPNLADFPTVGEPGWEDKLNDMMRGKRP